jgi:serine/threonine protein kinase
MTEPPDLLATALRDRYTLQRELGRGGMAVVWLAHDVRHDRPVALKLLHPELAAELGPERFLREIRLTARLQHPHIRLHATSAEAGDLSAPRSHFVRTRTTTSSPNVPSARRRLGSAVNGTSRINVSAA